MNTMENQLFRSIDKILWEDWDPIGVNDLGMCRDEYRSYVPEIYNLKVTGCAAEEISLKLFESSSREMDVILPMEICRQVAGKIVGLKTPGLLRVQD